MPIQQLIAHKKRGQVAVLDLFISAMIFGILVTAVMLLWNSYTIKIDNHIEKNTNLLRAYHISDLLTRYSGKPSNWHNFDEIGSNTIVVLGLAESDRVINSEKLNVFLDLDYDYIREKLSINQYDFYFKLTNIDGSDFDPIIEKGIETNTTTVSLRRYVIYNDEEAILEFKLQEIE